MNNTRAILEARPPLPWQKSRMHNGVRAANVMVVNRSTGQHREQRVVVVREHDPQYAYRRYNRKPSIPLGDHGEKGEIIFCQVLPRYTALINQQGGTTAVFEEPADPKFVAIKIVPRVGKHGVDRLVERGSNENPYHEIASMQVYGDYHNIMNIIEALWDARFLYMVMPASDRGDLDGLIPWNRGGLPEIQARTVFRNVLRNMTYLQERGVTHRDLKGKNILLDSDGGTRLIDLAMSLRVPHEGDGNLTTPHHLINRTGPCGTLAYMAPEAIRNEDFDGYAIDVWSLGVILFTLLTGERLYSLPLISDRSFEHFIDQNGLSDMELNNFWLQNGVQLIEQQPEFRDWVPALLGKIQLFMNLSLEARTLLSGMLQEDREQRYTLGQITDSAWMLIG
mmetsp:Transcript_30370/g.46572  ORF Transcript_30370/g.46572 Transcript_30370/m.46572 type:complete len:394 (-) Transcript_30370:584-1765(-)